MGVHKLWELLNSSSAGKPINIESLAYRRLAVDVSIWLFSFDTIRDENATLSSKTYLKGIFHRLCKLLYWNIKPIFVFDGATPEIKKKTVMARREQRQNSITAIRRVAKRILENRIKELKKSPKDEIKEGKQEKEDDQTLEEQSNQNSSKSSNKEDEVSSFDEEITIFEQCPTGYDPDVFYSLPPELQREVVEEYKKKMQENYKNRIKYLKKLSPSPSNFSQMQISNLLKTGEFNRQMRNNVGSTPQRHFMASDYTTELILTDLTKEDSQPEQSPKTVLQIPTNFDKSVRQNLETRFNAVQSDKVIEIKVDSSSLEEDLFDASLFQNSPPSSPNNVNIDLTKEDIEEDINQSQNQEIYPEELIELEASQLIQEYSILPKTMNSLLAEMISDLRELLMYFGIPYVFSPEEAEAQCATLHQLGLVDGIITEDSDTLLKVWR